MTQRHKSLSLRDQEVLISLLIEVGQKTNVPIKFVSPGNCGVTFDYQYFGGSSSKKIKGTLNEIEVPFPSNELRALILLHELGHIKDISKKGISKSNLIAKTKEEDGEKVLIQDYISKFRHEVNAWKEAIKLYDNLGFSFLAESWHTTTVRSIMTHYEEWAEITTAPPTKAKLLLSQLFAMIEQRCPGFTALMNKDPLILLETT